MSSDVVVSKSLKSKLLKGWVCLPSTQAEAPAIEASDKWFERSSRHSKVNSWQSLTKKLKHCLTLNVHNTSKVQININVVESFL